MFSKFRQLRKFQCILLPGNVFLSALLQSLLLFHIIHYLIVYVVLLINFVFLILKYMYQKFRCDIHYQLMYSLEPKLAYNFNVGSQQDYTAAQLFAFLLLFFDHLLLYIIHQEPQLHQIPFFLSEKIGASNFSVIISNSSIS